MMRIIRDHSSKITQEMSGILTMESSNGRRRRPAAAMAAQGVPVEPEETLELAVTQEQEALMQVPVVTQEPAAQEEIAVPVVQEPVVTLEREEAVETVEPVAVAVIPEQAVAAEIVELVVQVGIVVPVEQAETLEQEELVVTVEPEVREAIPVRIATSST
jgi:hypothetical protein